MTVRNFYVKGGLILIFLGIGCSALNAIPRRRKREHKKLAQPLVLESDAFVNSGPIPSEYTCDGQDVSPPLRWENIPPGTKSFVLIVDDPDARGGHWTHWLLYNLPASVHHLPRQAHIASLGGMEGLNSWKTVGWGGPCPPIRKHRYVFSLYALNKSKIRVSKKAARYEVLRAMKERVITKATLIGTYKKIKY